MDFVTGVIKSSVVSKRRGERFAFESIKAWRTIYKFVFILIGIVLAELLDHTLAEESRLRFANYFTAFCCGVEFWSFLENAAVISDHPIFRFLRKFMRVKLEDQLGTKFEENEEK
jgi:phage-related holin